MKFLTGKELENEINDTIFYAERYLLILSPFIQLDDYFKNEIFKSHLNNSQVQIILGFGKNEQNIQKSFKKQDIDYFTQFPNITIVYIPKLHGKYYGNEKKSIVTSMNLIDYSFINNIEFGASADRKILASNTFFEDSQNKCFETLEDEGFTIFVKRPKFKKKLFGLGKDYVGSEIELDLLDNISRGQEIERIKISSFRNEKYVNSGIKGIRIDRKDFNNQQTEKEEEDFSNDTHNGHCIRCKTEIYLDPDRPLCLDCFRTWNQYADEYYPENYCISCGEKNEVNFSKPACYTCYKKLENKYVW
ncbi:phospholipase D-like domain-containing protein [Luteirhabdus pelagi]|uniref:phospholipase D-like domain-containing protein n=1 Tax=Luteirhabdus pelagi TaxID=2792783 RepID=UPI0019395907|nr:phospholipase D-like domain-containing protein [Luteirhabdus pelagi]